MISVSNEYKSIAADQETPPDYTAKATITLSNGTVLNITDADIIMGGLKIEDATSENCKFEIGAAKINQCTLSLNNIEGMFDEYDFTDAVIIPYVGLRLSNSIEWLKKGIYTVDNPSQGSSVIKITALDNMSKFDKNFKDVAVTFPCTATVLLEAICTYCGVLYDNSYIDDYVITSRPDNEAITCHEMISYIAGLGGNFARFNTSGILELKWYDFEVFELPSVDGGIFDSNTPYSTGDNLDGGNFTDYSSGDSFDGGSFDDMNRYHHIYLLKNIDVATDDVVITGIQVSDNSEVPNTVLFGTSGYVLSIEKNPLIQSLADAQNIANKVGAKIVGMKFRPLSITAKADPSREGGDVAYVTDRKQNTYQVLLTSVSFCIGQVDKLSCDAETPSKNSSKQPSALTKAIIEARKNAEVKLTAYDLLVQQMTNVIANGLGVFRTRVSDESGAMIEYLHDKLLMSDSTVRWFTTADGSIEQNKVDGIWVTVSGTDKQGNALYNVLYARKVSADIIRTGKILSDDGSVLIDMAYGVANSDNISFTDNIQEGYQLTMPFNIDDAVSKINKVLLKYTQQNFRTYSTTASSGGGVTQASLEGGGETITSENNEGFVNNFHLETGESSVGISIDSGGSINQSTGLTDSTIGNHAHSISVGDHSHSATGYGHTHSYDYSWELPQHTHTVIVKNHTHDVDIPNHEHGLNFGIKENPITDYSFDIYVDGVQTLSVTNDLANSQGIIDLTAYITTVGWHSIEIKSNTLKRVSAQVNIKSYIRS